MKYRKFGNTGAKVSILGFGAMRLPMVGEGENQQVDLDKSVPMIQKGLDSGINYIDTAWAYLNETSERAVGEAISRKGPEQALCLHQKPHEYGACGISKKTGCSA